MIDPVTLAVIRGRLEQIVDEMDASLFRSAFSPVIAEARDGSHGIYHAGDLLFTARSGRVDLPGGDYVAQWKSVLYARNVLRALPPTWRLIPGHRYDWIDGTTPDWVSLEQALAHNFALNSSKLEDFDQLPFLRFDDDLAA